MSFADDIQAFADKTEQKLEDTVVAVIFKLNESIIEATPVDTGRARGGWVASLGSPSSAKGGSASGAKSRADSVAKKAGGKIYYLTNNVVYIRVLEYGEYPNPPKKGTYDKQTGLYEIRSAGGYSKLAPVGMVRASVEAIKGYIQKQIGIM